MKILNKFPRRQPTPEPEPDPATEPEVATDSAKATKATNPKTKRKISSLKLRE